MNRKKKNNIFFLKILISTILLLGIPAAVWYEMSFAREFLYFPMSKRQNKCIASNLGELDKLLKMHQIDSSCLIELGNDHLKFQAIHLKADTGNNYLILIHGKKECPFAMLRGGLTLRDMGFSVIIPNYYAHGYDSAHRWIDYGKHAVIQVDSCISYAKKTGAEKIGIVGRSMGASIGIIATGRNQMVDAIVAECPAKSVQSSIGYKHSMYSQLPDFPILQLKIMAVKIALRDNLDSLAAINFIGRIAPRPVFIMAATNDQVINPQDFIELYNEAKEPKMIWKEPLDHTKFHSQLSDEFYRKTREFFVKSFYP